MLLLARVLHEPGRLAHVLVPAHPRLVARLRSLASRSGPLQLAGSYLAGVSVADTLASGAGTVLRN